MILSILKIIGIVILVILILIIVLLGIVLFVPIRYRFSGIYRDKLNGRVRVLWIPCMLKVLVDIKDNQFQYSIRLLGGVIMTNKEEKISWIGRRIFKEDKNQYEREDIIENEDEKNEFSSTKKPTVEKTEQNEKENSIEKTIEQLETKKSSVHDKKTKKKNKTKKKKESIKDKMARLKKKVSAMFDKLKDLNKKREALLKVYHSPRFGQAKKDVIQYLKYVFRILKPDKLEGYVHFGTGDPADTGQIFGKLAMALPLYYRFLTLKPDFEEKVLEADLNGKGKIRLVSIAILALKIMFNKNLIKVTKKVQTIVKM